MSIPEYLIPLEKLFLEHADLQLAAQMKKYMKDRSDFFGITSPKRKELYALHTKNVGPVPPDQKEEIAKWCWNAPQREYQYFALEFLGKLARKADPEDISLYEFLLVHKSWWDTVDYISPNLVGVYLKKYPERIMKITSAWMDSGNMWLQRACLLFQLKYRDATDTELLGSFIFQLMDSKEFFIRKAIGWSLREYSKTNPGYVIKFVKENTLSGLSEREALKRINAKIE